MDRLALTNAALEFIDERRKDIFENAYGLYGDEDRASVLREIAQITLEMERLSRILECARAVAKMRHPSIEKLLRRQGFGYEADRVADLVRAADTMFDSTRNNDVD